MLQEFALKVNGHIHRIVVEPETPLLYILRNDLGLKAAKFACGLEQCGACRVIIDGEAVPSCKIPVRNVQGSEITTLEGLGTAGNLHPVQRAFIEEGAIQCGFCVSGMVLAAKAILDRNPQPTDEEIREGLAVNLCRCGVYGRILKAVKRAAGRPTGPPSYQQAVPKVLDIPLETGSPDPTIKLPPSLLNTPDLDSWVCIDIDGTITLFTGKVELGQGIKTAIAQIGAEELDISIDRVRVVTADTGKTPDEGFTVGSMSLETSGNAIRLAAAEARRILLSIAYEELEAPIDHLRVTDGTITDLETRRSTTYWKLFGGQKFNHRISGLGRPKKPEERRLVSQPSPRTDLLAKVTGEARFIHDLDLSGMVHGRVVRPPNQAARLVSLDKSEVENLPGVLAVVRDGSFLAVIAAREEQAVKAAQALQGEAVWEGKPELPDQDAVFEHLLSQPDQPLLVVDGTPVDGPIPPIKTMGAAHTLSATYCRPFQMHASLGPSAAAAQLEDGRLTIWTHSQGVFGLREAVAQVVGMDTADIRVIHVEGPGCYGHNGADDAALDAALLARNLPGNPISLKWTREDEFAWEPYGAATVIQMGASLDERGSVIDWNHDVWGYTHLGRPRPGGRTSGLLAAWHLADPLERPKPQPIKAYHVGIHRNADPLYAFPRKRIVKHFLPNSPFRVSALRSLGAYANVFAIESFMDELALESGADPVEFRLRHLEDERARAVIKAAADKSDWNRPRGDGRGLGIGFARYKNKQCYCAVVVELSVDRDSGQVNLERAFIAADAGEIINPDGLSSQLEGGFVQSSSWTLKEKVRFDGHGVFSTDWESYPIMRFPRAPEVETVLLNRPEQPLLGVGEAAMGPSSAAIANAVFDAVSVRLREIPFTPQVVRKAITEGARH